MRRLSIFAATLLLYACTDLTQPEPSGAPVTQGRNTPALPGRPAPDLETRALLDAARAKPPIDASDHLVVGALEEGRTPTMRTVVFDNGVQREVYRFRRTSSGWEQGERMEAGPRADIRRGVSPSISASMAMYSSPIAVIGNSDNWYTDKSATGDYSYSKRYTNTYGSAQFYPGTQVVGGARQTVTFQSWSAWNSSYPGCNWYSFGTTLFSSGCQVYPWGYPGPYIYVDADFFTAYYHMDVVPVLTAYISGPGQYFSSGTYTWEAMPSNGNGTYSYQWQVYWENTGVTQVLGTGKTQSIYLGPAYGNFTLSVTVTSGGETASTNTWVADMTGSCGRDGGNC